MRKHIQQPVTGPSGKENAKRASAESKQQTFGQHLPDEARPAGPDAHAHGNLPLASRGAREREISDVGARDQ